MIRIVDDDEASAMRFDLCSKPTDGCFITRNRDFPLKKDEIPDVPGCIILDYQMSFNGLEFQDILGP